MRTHVSLPEQNAFEDLKELVQRSSIPDLYWVWVDVMSTWQLECLYACKHCGLKMGH